MKIFIVTLKINDRRCILGYRYKSFSRESDYRSFMKHNSRKVRQSAMVIGIRHGDYEKELTMGIEEIDTYEWKFK